MASGTWAAGQHITRVHGPVKSSVWKTWHQAHHGEDTCMTQRAKVRSLGGLVQLSWEQLGPQILHHSLGIFKPLPVLI